MSKNPLFTSSVFPAFSSIRAKHVKEAVQKALTDCYNTVDHIASQKKIVTWDQLYYPLMVVENKLQRIWSPIAHLNSVKHDLKLRKVYEENLLYISEYKNWVNHHHGLYKSYQSLRNSDSYHDLSIMQKTVLTKILNNFKLSGIYLSSKQKKIYKNIDSRLSQLSIQYANNVFDATLGWSKLITDKKVLSGIPHHTLKIARLAAQAQEKEGWLFTLQYPSYSSVLTYCDTKELREELYWAFNTRASDQGPNSGKWDNTLIMDEILALRYESAQILGFNNYLEKSLETKMVKNPKKIFSFLINLSEHLCHYEQKEFLEIQNFSKRYYSCKSLQPWDLAYYKEKQKQELFFINDEELRWYFPEKKVLNGMFTLVKYIYGLTIKERYYLDVWDSNVRFFDIFDIQGEWRGGFYLDIYLRDNKCGGAWMDEFVSMMYKHNALHQKPIAYLICNFDCEENKKEKSCLLSHNDVITLFHEFGHVLHHIMTCVDIPEISGINGLPWDAVELPSQLMEKFCWEPNVLQLISMHYITGNPLSNQVIDNLLKTKEYQASSSLLRQIIYGLFDLKIHYEYVPRKQNQILTILNKIIKKISVYPVMDWDRFPHSFIHIFSNDYAAGYYSYLWADMLASNIWVVFKKKGILNSKVGISFLDNVLSLDACIDLSQCLTRFCGQKLTIKPMLRYYGIPTSRNLSIFI